MHVVARIFCIIALAVYAGGAAIQSAGAVEVGSAIQTQDGSMADCDACDHPDASITGIACDFVCNAGSLVALQALLPAADSNAVASSHDGVPIAALRGISGSRLSQPPRVLL